MAARCHLSDIGLTATRVRLGPEMLNVRGSLVGCGSWEGLRDCIASRRAGEARCHALGKSVFVLTELVDLVRDQS